MSEIQDKTSDEFEFNDVQNMVFDGLATAMKIAGIAEILLALAYAVPAVLALSAMNTPVVVVAVLQIGVVVLMAVWTLKAATHVKAVVKTEGDDIAHLMDALGGIRKMFYLQAAVLLALLVLNVIAAFTGGEAPKAP
jgi:hypothetical protein